MHNVEDVVANVINVDERSNETPQLFCMDSEPEDSGEWQQFQPDMLIQGLRCPVCLEYFARPHTLLCGHTFCLRCLRTLARLARHARDKIPLERLRFRCPTCRKFCSVRPILKRRVSINYTIKELIDDWFQSPYSSGSVITLLLRSVASQTKSPSDSEQNVTPTSSTEDLTKGVSSEEFRQIVYHKIPPKKEVIDKDIFELKTTTSAPEESSLSDENNMSSDDESMDGERLNLQVVDDQPIRFTRVLFRGRTFSVAGALRMLFDEIRLLFVGIWQSRSRMALTFCWFLYGAAVIYISHSFWPYMCFYTMIYFLILYAEISQPAFFRG